jgi:hypothetical protein
MRETLDGLKEFQHICYCTFTDIVILFGFMLPCIHRGVFVLYDKEDHGVGIATLVLYVNDVLIIGNNGMFGQIKDQMKTRFRMHYLGSVSIYLGMNIGLNWEHLMIDIRQRSYVQTTLEKFRMDESRPVATPMAVKLQKRKPDKEACNPTIYQSMIGSLMYAMTASRPDIKYAIEVLS